MNALKQPHHDEDAIVTMAKDTTMTCIDHDQNTPMHTHMTMPMALSTTVPRVRPWGSGLGYTVKVWFFGPSAQVPDSV